MDLSIAQLDESDLTDKLNAYQRPATSTRTRIISYVQPTVATSSSHGFSKPPLGLSEMVNPAETDESGKAFDMGTVFVKGIHQAIRKIKWKKAIGNLPLVNFVVMNFEVFPRISSVFVYNGLR